MLNSIAIQGRLVHTPEAKVTKSGKDVCTFSIACDRQSGGQKETDFFNCTAFGNTALFVTDFFNCTAFGNTALFVSKWFQKGSLILVTGSIQTRKYTDKQRNNRTATEIMANKVDFCGGKSDSKPADRAQDAPQNYSQGNEDDFSVIDDSSDLPFN